MQLNRPSHADHQRAMEFRQRDLEEMRYYGIREVHKQLEAARREALEAQLKVARKDARVLAKFAKQFLVNF